MLTIIMNYLKQELKNFRHFLYKHVILYALLAGIGVVTFWKGVWGLLIDLESVSPHIFSNISSSIIGVLLLLAIGIFASNFVGSDIISKIKKEEEKIEKTEEELEHDIIVERNIEEKILKKVKEIEDKINQNNICG